MVLLTYIKEGHELCLNLLQLLGILIIGVLQVLKGTTWVDVVARVDTYLLAILCGHIGGMCREVHIGHKGRCVAIFLQPCRDVLHVLGLAGALCCKAYQFSSGINDAFGLGYAAFGVVGVDGSHRLDADGIVTTDGDVAHMNNGASSSFHLQFSIYYFILYRYISALPTPC